jgi:hypothetical protein
MSTRESSGSKKSSGTQKKQAGEPANKSVAHTQAGQQSQTGGGRASTVRTGRLPAREVRRAEGRRRAAARDAGGSGLMRNLPAQGPLEILSHLSRSYSWRMP